MRMTEGKERRQRAIAGLIRDGGPSSQEELAERLSKLGFSVTQATISRDLEQIGAVKVRRSGQLSYALGDQAQSGGHAQLPNLLRDFVRSIDTAANLLVIEDSSRIGTPHRSCARPIEPAGGCRHDLRRRHDLRGLRESRGGFGTRYENAIRVFRWSVTGWNG